MSYEGGGTQGPPGPTGPTGPSGGDFSGPTGAILWYDGSGITGTTGLVYNGVSTISSESSNNYINLDGMGGIVVSIDAVDVGRFINLYAGSSSINISDAYVSEVNPYSATINLATSNLIANISNETGITGQYLGSDGAGKVVWSTPLPSGLAEIGITGSTDYYIALPFTPVITQNAVIQATLQVPDDDTQNWIVYAEPTFGPANSQFIHVNFASAVANGGTTIAWAVIALDCTPSNPTTGIPV